MTTFLLIRHGETDANRQVADGLDSGLASQRTGQTAGGITGRSTGHAG